MKKIGFFIMASFLLYAYSFAQVTTLTFTAKDTNGFYICLDRAVINNLTKNWTETIYYPDTVLILGTSGIGDAKTNSQFSLFRNVPNPFAGVSEFSIQLAEPQKVTISVFDAEGRKITTTEKSLLPGEHAFRLLLSTPQTYLLHVRAGTEQASLTVINTGNAGTNRIEYLQNLRSPLKTNRGQTDNPFDLGDEMEYVGFAIINDTEFESEHIQQLQLTSESFELLFAVYKLPNIITTAISNITYSSATSGGVVISDGNLPVTIRGVCWSTLPNPTITDTHTADGSGLGGFTSSITGLSANTIYYVRAYATNSIGTAYGNAISFATFALPTVITATIANITSSSATSGGDVIFDGNTSVTARGVCWSTLPNPTISDAHTSDGNGLGVFTSSITGLSANTTYYVRAYATNSVGTAYGNVISFTTFALPTVITATIANITSTSATSGGNVTFDGNTFVTARGVCWSTTPNPTISNAHTSNGNGLGVFTSTITGLSANTTYYVRAYATNSVGTSYGNSLNFTTILSSSSCENGVNDIDGNHYNGVEIGTQCWMKQNLRVEKYSNGTAIPLGTSTNTTTIYRYYPNNSSGNVSTFGYLYNWPAVMGGSSSSSSNPSGVQGVCPIGWHVPSNAEWIQLTNYVSSQSAFWCNSNSSYIAKALASTSGWNSHTGTCTVGNDPSSNNATGFGIVSAGLYNGNYGSFGSLSFLWSATENNATFAWSRSLYNSNAEVLTGNIDKYRGYSVRCLRD